MAETSIEESFRKAFQQIRNLQAMSSMASTQGFAYGVSVARASDNLYTRMRELTLGVPVYLEGFEAISGNLVEPYPSQLEYGRVLKLQLNQVSKSVEQSLKLLKVSEEQGTLFDLQNRVRAALIQCSLLEDGIDQGLVKLKTLQRIAFVKVSETIDRWITAFDIAEVFVRNQEDPLITKTVIDYLAQGLIALEEVGAQLAETLDEDFETVNERRPEFVRGKKLQIDTVSNMAEPADVFFILDLEGKTLSSIDALENCQSQQRHLARNSNSREFAKLAGGVSELRRIRRQLKDEYFFQIKEPMIASAIDRGLPTLQHLIDEVWKVCSASKQPGVADIIEQSLDAFVRQTMPSAEKVELAEPHVSGLSDVELRELITQLLLTAEIFNARLIASAWLGPDPDVAESLTDSLDAHYESIVHGLSYLLAPETYGKPLPGTQFRRGLGLSY